MRVWVTTCAGTTTLHGSSVDSLCSEAASATLTTSILGSSARSVVSLLGAQVTIVTLLELGFAYARRTGSGKELTAFSIDSFRVQQKGAIHRVRRIVRRKPYYFRYLTVPTISTSYLDSQNFK